jgi:hypothetical protein
MASRLGWRPKYPDLANGIGKLLAHCLVNHALTSTGHEKPPDDRRARWLSEENQRMDDPPPFLQNIFRVVDETIFPACACIIHSKGLELHQHRSGVFVQVADKRFLVTAAHYLEALHKAGIDSFIAQGEQGSHPVFILTERWYTTIREQADLAVCLLEPALVEYLGPKVKYLRITDFIPKQECRDGWFVIAGYPFDRFGPDEDGVSCREGWKYVTRRFDDTDLVENYDPNTHLVVKYERTTTDEIGRTVHPPAMSGCGIWFMRKQPPEIILPDDLKLCAIQNAWSKRNEYAKGTWTDVVLNIIWTYFPEVQPAMRLHGCSF